MVRQPPLAVALLACVLAFPLSAVPAAAVNLDTTVTPLDVRIGSVPGSATDTWTYSAEAGLQTPLQALAADQPYHLTLHVTPGIAFRLDPADAGLNIILYSQNRAANNGNSVVSSTGIGTVQLVGQNVSSAPVSLDLHDELDATRVGVTIVGPTTYSAVKVQPAQTALVSDLTFDFTLPADFSSSPGGPFDLVDVALAATETVPHGQTGPQIIGFAQVPEPGALAGLLMTLPLISRRRSGFGFWGSAAAVKPSGRSLTPASTAGSASLRD